LHYSGVPFVWASLHEKLEAFLEGHVRWFAWVNGVVEKMVYDNLTPVVRKIVQGHEGRELSERFVALRSHYVFDSVFANPGAAHEKGSVENLVGYVRRDVLLPVRHVVSLDEPISRSTSCRWCRMGALAIPFPAVASCSGCETRSMRLGWGSIGGTSKCALTREPWAGARRS